MGILVMCLRKSNNNRDLKGKSGFQTAVIGSKGALFYASISIMMPDLNSKMKWLEKTVI